MNELLNYRFLLLSYLVQIRRLWLTAKAHFNAAEYDYSHIGSVTPHGLPVQLEYLFCTQGAVTPLK